MIETQFRTFGEMVHHQRRAASLSQLELSIRAGVSRTTVSNIENNNGQSERGLPYRPTVENIEAICDVLGLDATTAKLMVYPPDNSGAPVVIAGEHARLPQTSTGVDLAKTIEELQRQGHLYVKVGNSLLRTAAELAEFRPS